ncbi:MAG TPA: hypothetical protein VEM32_05755, partial [Geobacteraceae bacterium]|nr:hypothetical protein [Geobacteraceae bacterium]
MPVEDCSEGGKPGYRWGSSGACYVYAAGDDAARRKAKQRAYIQGAAVQASQSRRGEKPKGMPVDLIISKQFEAHFEAPAGVPPEILAKINTLAPEPVPADQVYFTWADLANTEYDRSH